MTLKWPKQIPTVQCQKMLIMQLAEATNHTLQNQREMLPKLSMLTLIFLTISFVVYIIFIFYYHTSRDFKIYSQFTSFIIDNNMN